MAQWGVRTLLVEFRAPGTFGYPGEGQPMKNAEKCAAVAICLGGLAGCAARAAEAPAVNVAAPAHTAEAKAAPAPLPALTEEERDMVVRLRATVQHFAVEIGER